MHLFTRKKLTVYLGLCLPFTSVAASSAASTPAADQLETVVVIGEQIKQELKKEHALTPGGVTLVDSDELYQRNVSSLADMLRYVPGVWAASSSGSDTMFFSSRGSNLDATSYDMNGIKLLQDGLPVTTADGNNHNRVIDPLSARYATVARGANALTYGASTLGGAIDFTSPTAHDTQPELFINGGSNGQLLGRLTTGAVAGDIDGVVTLEAKQWDGYRDHSEQTREGIYANAGWRLSDTVRSRLYVSYIDNNEQLPGTLTREQVRDNPDQASQSAIGGNFQVNVDTWRIANKTSWDINENSSLTFGLSYEEQTLYHPIVDKVMVDFDGPGPQAPTEVFSLLINTEQHNLGSSLRYNLRVGEHDLLAGLNYGDTTVEGGEYRNDGGRRNGLSTRVDNHADSLELFLVDRWQVAPRWTLVYGTQFVAAGRDVRTIDVATNEVRNPNNDFNSVNPRAGVIYSLTPGIELFSNLSRLYEAPTNYELKDDMRGGNQTLDAMHGTVLEVGSRGKHAFNAASYIGWDIALYYASLGDEILSVDNRDAPGTSLSTNIDDTTHAGIEMLVRASVALDANATHRLEPLINLTVNHFRFDNDATYGNNQLPAAPGYALKGELLYRHSAGFFAGPSIDIVDQRYADFTNTYELDSYTLLGLRAGLTRKIWEVYGELRNLTDKHYIATHSVRDTALANDAILSPGEPRSMYMGVKLQF